MRLFSPYSGDRRELDEFPDCVKNFMIIQAHHDYCPEDKVPAAIETDFHTFEEKGCMGCKIDKAYDATLTTMCPLVDCTDKPLIESARALIEAGCSETGSPPVTTCCQNPSEHGAWRIVRSFHNMCDADDIAALGTVIETFIEEAIHDYEEDCEAVCQVGKCYIRPPDSTRVVVNLTFFF